METIGNERIGNSRIALKRLYSVASLGTIFMVLIFCSFSFANPCIDILDQDDKGVLSSDTMIKISALEREDGARVFDPEHGSSIRLIRNETGQPIKTKKVVLIFHGLLNSPKWMRTIEDLSFDSGFNVMNIRLENHHETDRYALDRVSYQQWLFQADRTFQVARELGDEVVIVGHSTGGVLAASLGFAGHESIGTILLLAPALKLNRPLELTLRTASFLNVTGRHIESILRTRFAKYLSSSAGIQVIDLAKWYRQGVTDSLNLPKALRPQPGARKLRIAVVDSASDKIVDPKSNEEFIRWLGQFPEAIDATYLQIPLAEKVKHDDIPQGNNRAHEAYVLESLRKLLAQ